MNPCFQKKKKLFILHFRPLGAFLVFTKIFTFWSILLLGIGDPPKNSKKLLLLGIGDLPPKLPVFTFGNKGQAATVSFLSNAKHIIDSLNCVRYSYQLIVAIQLLLEK